MFTSHEKNHLQKNPQFRLFLKEFSNLKTKIQKLKNEPQDAYIKNKLNILEWIRNECEKIINDYNQDYEKYAKNLDKLEIINEIFSLKMGVLLCTLANDNNMFSDLSQPRTNTGSLITYIPPLAFLFTGMVTTVVSGPLMGILGGTIGATSAMSIPGLKAYLPESAQIVINLFNSLPQNVGKYEHLATCSGFPKLQQWLNHAADPNAREDTVYFRLHDKGVEIYGRGVWLPCNTITHEEIFSVQNQVIKTNDSQHLPIFLKVAITIAHAILEE